MPLFSGTPQFLASQTLLLNIGDSHANGVLHGTNMNYDYNNLNSGDIYVNETKVSGSYELVAQSIGHSDPQLHWKRNNSNS